jgi:hypothetical protein
VARPCSALGGNVDPIDAAAREIAQYVHEHPNARDTLQGVRDWWLAGRGPLLPLDAVQAALDRLVADGCLSVRRIPGAVTYGSAAQEHEP